MEAIGYIIAIGLIIGGFVTLFKDGRENGIGFVIFELLAVGLLVVFGL